MIIKINKLYIVRDTKNGFILHWNYTFEGAAEKIEALENFCNKNNCFVPDSVEIVDIDISKHNFTKDDLDDIQERFDIYSFLNDKYNDQYRGL